jgi:UDP-2,3-diacylglucosamine pyrophosphatase LpxH
MKYRSLFISDVHLGTKFAKAEELLEFIKTHESENIYLVGDIIDGWAIKKKLHWKQSYSDVIQKILRAARKGSNVYYLTGNHDEFLRSFLPLMLGNSLHVMNDLEYEAINGERYFVVHGDMFDSLTLTKRWLSIFGDAGYDILLHFNPAINMIRRFFGFKRHWSLSKHLKDDLRERLDFIHTYETMATKYVHQQGLDGVICGHIHKADIKSVDGVAYKNCGDWVESCTALAETVDGEWLLLNARSNAS